MMKKILKWALAIAAIFLVGAQFIQPERTNPQSDPAASFEAMVKPAPAVAAIINRACRDCHTNRTVWPWYSKIAPMSWLVAQDVKEGREHLNFSEWNRLSPEMSKLRIVAVCAEVRKGDMPLWYYLPMHSEARLSPADISALCKAAQ